MKKTTIIIVMAVLCLFLKVVHGQIRPLKPGDALPEITISNMVNGESTRLSLSAVGNKLVILDFWATWCGTCIPSLIKLDSLQREFKEEIFVLPVTSQTESVALPFLKKRSINLPSVTNDAVLKRYFPHTSVPHQVWILDGRVEAITTHYSATADNIRKLLSRNQPNEMVMKLDLADFKTSSPLLAGGNGGDGKELAYQSMITGHLEGAGYHNLMTPGHIMITNNSVEYLFRKAFEKDYPWSRYENRLLVDTDEATAARIMLPEGLKGEERLRWYKQNSFSFDLYMPEQKDVKELAVMMQHDLNRYFARRYRVKAEIQSREVDCLVLTRADSASAPAVESTISVPVRELNLENVSFSKFFESLTAAMSSQKRPLVDESGYTGNVTIRLALSPSDLERLNAGLKSSGFMLSQQKRELPMLVIRRVN